MKKLIPFIFTLAFINGYLCGQGISPTIGGIGVTLVATAPSGSCTAGVQGQMVTATGAIWTCQSGTWATVGGSSGPVNATQVNGASVPASAAYVGTNSSSQIVAAATPSSGAMVLLEENTGSTVTSLPVVARNVGSQTGATFQSDFDDYVLKFIGFTVATNAAEICVQVTPNAGSSYDTGSNYSWAGLVVQQAGSSGGIGSVTDTKMCLTNSVSNTAGVSLSSSLELTLPLSTSLAQQWAGLTSAPFSGQAGSTTTWQTGMMYKALAAFNGFQVISSTGNISGTVRVYGIAK